MIAVMGGSGNTGRSIAEQLLKDGEKVRALGRSAERLASLKSLGAEILTGDATDGTFLSGAFRGADAVYTMCPPDFHSTDYRALQDRHGEAIVQAIRSSKVRHVVCLSSIGGDLAEGTGPIAGLHAQEERLKSLARTNVLILRPAYFFENFYMSLPMIKHQGINGGALAPDVAMPMIASRDVADVAARALKARDFNGTVVRELLGERDLTQAEATRILGAKVGKADLPYVQFPYEGFAAALVGAGLSQNAADLFIEMSRAFNEGRIKSREGRNVSNTTSTRFEDFAEGLAAAYPKV